MSTATIYPPQYVELTKLLRMREAHDLKRNYSAFVRASWPIVEPGIRYLHNWHIDLIAEHLLDVRDSITTRIVFNIPPRYMKSLLVTVDYAPWVWTEIPEERFLFTSYDDKLVKKHSIMRRNIIESEWYQTLWGAYAPAPSPNEVDRRVILASDQNEKKEFMNTRRGLMIAAPIDGGLTGHGGNTIIIDDPQNPKEADSETQRQSAQNFYVNTLLSRLDDKKKGRIILVMQRLHKKDLTGYVLEEGGWTHVKLPAVAPEPMAISFPRSKRVVNRAKDEPLWHEREDSHTLAIMKKAMRNAFTGQYQQEPTEAEGMILKRAWWKYYTPLADVVPITPPNHVLVEDKANGPAVISIMQQRIIGLIAVEPMGSKLARASAASGALEAGQIFLPSAESEKKLPVTFDEIVDSWDCAFKDTDGSDFVVGTKWGRVGAHIFLLHLVRDRMNFPETCAAMLNMARMTSVTPVMNVNVVDFVEECAAFKGISTDTDDQVDSWSQAILHFIKSMGGMIAWLERAHAEEEAKKAAQKQAAQDERARFREVNLGAPSTMAHD